MPLYSQVNAEGILTHRHFTDDPNFQPQEGHRILLDNIPTANNTHYPQIIQPTPADATEITYAWMPVNDDPTLSFLQTRSREERDRRLLKHIDNINVIEWENFTDAEKQEVRDYRQALLDMPETESFGHSDVWPAIPSCIQTLIAGNREEKIWNFVKSMIRKDGSETIFY